MTPSKPPPKTRHRAHLDRQRAQLPESPGVYLYSDAKGEVLYVGKAKSLRKRVNSYFTKSHDTKTHALVMRIANIEIFVVSSEREALVFEQRLIQRHRPPFNIMLRDDKSYPWIAITTGDEFPRVIFTRERHRKGVRYFGPYSSARRTREALDLLNRIFPYRPCEGERPGRQSGVPCLDFHIERCCAPCITNVTKEQYAAVITDVTNVLDGKIDEVRSALTEQMAAASAALDFERAARVRNRIADLDVVAELQAAEIPGAGSFDVMGVAVREPTGVDGETTGVANVQVLQVRDGRLSDRSSHYLDQVDGLDQGTVLTQFILAYYEPGRPIPPLVVTSHDVLSDADTAMLEEALAPQRAAAVEVRGAMRGEKRRLAELSMRNAMHALEYETIRRRTTLERRHAALEQLRDELGLDSLPLRIECYDISNLQEQAPVASMVVFEDGRPRRDHYRSFAMRHDQGQDDFAMMAEVITRRFTRHESMDEEDASFASTPNLVVIDGGKGQLGAAVTALRDVGGARVSVVSLAKREEHVFVPGRPDPIVMDRRSSGLQLLQQVRDEAHRFALRHHRIRRSAGMTDSLLDTLEGIGPARRRALLNHFGSPERVLQARLEELEAVPGLPGKVARTLWDQLNRLGTGSA